MKPFENGELKETILRVKEKINESKKKNNTDMKDFSDVLKKGYKSKYVTEAIDYIANNFSNRKISVDTIAESLGISGGHLSHIFKKETDNTLMSYITHCRVNAAMNMLRDCRYKVYEVAEMVGYRDITYFSTMFKNMVGMTPSEYQERSK